MSFLQLSGITVGDRRFEIASRPRLDTRQVLPFYREGSELLVGVLERDRASRVLRGEPAGGWEAIGVDFGGVDETGDILAYGRAAFTAHAQVAVDDAKLAIPLPSHARSIGYLTELALPLLLPVVPPPQRSFDVAWEGETHRIVFLPHGEAVDRIQTGAVSAAESLLLLLLALSPPAPPDLLPPGELALPPELRTADDLARLLAAAPSSGSGDRAPLASADLRFLALHQVPHKGGTWELLTPASGLAVAVLPYVETPVGKVYFLYEEPRPASLERRLRAPLFDLPVSASFVNAAAVFTSKDAGQDVQGLLQSAFPGAHAAHSHWVSPPLETCPGTSTERRQTVVVRLRDTPVLPPQSFAIREGELVDAVARGLVHDPVVALALLSSGLDPFGALRTGEPASRRRFLDVMTQGSVVQRRLRSYSGIEQEQLGSPTYARLMLLLQHRFGVRIAYPETEADRSFFKAAFRVFMADGREDHRELQGLHWSHDAYHFALGNYTLPDSFDFAAFYLSDEPAPPRPTAEEEASYIRALKAAEDEATFFSFFTLFAEQPSLARHVGKLTYWQALREMGLDEPLVARALFDDLTVRAILPQALIEHPLYAAREDLRSLFGYMQGFRDYHFKDIEIALSFARKDPYRGYFLRFGLYAREVETYVADVRSFPERLAHERPGLHPLLAALSDQKLSLALLVWDVTKALRLLRTATANAEGRAASRQRFLDVTNVFAAELDEVARAEQTLRSRIHGAELTAENEAAWGEVGQLGERLHGVHERLWSWVESEGRLGEEIVARERARKLPR